MNTSTKVKKLPDIAFLAGASASLKNMLESQATELSFDADEVLFEQGDEGDALFAIIEGAIEFTVLSMDGRRLALDMMRPGALFGEISLFDPGARTATATAAIPSRVWRIRNSDVLAQIRRQPELGVDMILLAGQRMRWMGSQFNEQVFLPMQTRLARKILYLAPEIDGAESKLTLSQAELAEFVGATREAVSKTLAIWKRLGIVKATRGGLLVLDRDALDALAEPDLI